MTDQEKHIRSQRSIQWNKNHPEEAKSNQRRYYMENKEKLAEKKKIWRLNNIERERFKDREKKRLLSLTNPEKVKTYRKTKNKGGENYEAQCLAVKVWRKNHPEKVVEMARRRNMKRRNTPCGKINDSLSTSIRRALKGNKAGCHWENIVGFSVGQLRKHLEGMFKPGWVWENYGTVWVIDHKIPKSVFNYEKPTDLDFKRCWSLENLQPLDKFDNLKKSNRLEKIFQPMLLIGG